MNCVENMQSVIEASHKSTADLIKFFESEKNFYQLIIQTVPTERHLFIEKCAQLDTRLDELYYLLNSQNFILNGKKRIRQAPPLPPDNNFKRQCY